MKLLYIILITFYCSTSLYADNKNKTLLGIDANNNKIRDDIELWIDKNYKHPIEKALLTQAAKLYQKQLKLSKRMSSDKKFAIEFKMKELNSYTACELYWTYDALDAGESFVLSENSKLKGYTSDYFTKPLDDKQFNTSQRKKAANVLEDALIGRVCPLVEPDKSKCDFDAKKLIKGYK